MSDVKESAANSRQIGGEHYKRVPGEMLWDRLVRLYGLPHARSFFVGSILSYIERYQFKDGIRDLEKAEHFLQKLIELERAYEAQVCKNPHPQPKKMDPPTVDELHTMITSILKQVPLTCEVGQ